MEKELYLRMMAIGIAIGLDGRFGNRPSLFRHPRNPCHPRLIMAYYAR